LRFCRALTRPRGGANDWRPAAIQHDACRRHALQIHKPSARVSFGLPGPLSFQVSKQCHHGSQIGDKHSTGKASQVRLLGSLTYHLGNAMRAWQKSKRKKAKANRTFTYVSSTLSMAT
jgi:hypothetical protein